MNNLLKKALSKVSEIEQLNTKDNIEKLVNLQSLVEAHFLHAIEQASNELQAEAEKAGFGASIEIGDELINAAKVTIDISDVDKVTVYADGDVGIFVNNMLFCRHLSENIEWKLVPKDHL